MWMNNMNGNLFWNNVFVYLFFRKVLKFFKKFIDVNLRNILLLEGVFLYYNLFIYECFK